MEISTPYTVNRFKNGGNLPFCLAAMVGQNPAWLIFRRFPPFSWQFLSDMGDTPSVHCVSDIEPIQSSSAIPTIPVKRGCNMVNQDRVTIRMSADLRDTLNKLAQDNRRSPSEIIREAIDLYQKVQSGGTDNDRRRQFSHEFLFLVVDKYLAQTDQKTYDHLVAEAARRVENLYAQP